MFAWTLLIILVILAVVFTLYYILSLYGLFKGAPFVSTDKQIVEKMIELAEIKKEDKAYDLGCGDGRIIFEACKKGAIGVGFEIHPFLVWYCRFKNIFYKLPVKFICKDFLKQDLSDADIVFCYLLPGIMGKLTDKFKELKPETRIVSHGFKIPGWKMVSHYVENKEKSTGNIYVYKV